MKELSDYYFTFGWGHYHNLNGHEFDKDTVVHILAEDAWEAREIMESAFGMKWSMQYDEKPDMSYFPKGIISLND